MDVFMNTNSSASLLQSMEEDGVLDWPLELPLGRRLDKLQDDLLCPICQSLFTNPHMLKCGHSFCSLCIRKHCDATYNRTTHEICPCCREKADLVDLRKNVSLASVIDKYREFGKDLLDFLISKPSELNEVQDNGMKGKKRVRMVTPGLYCKSLCSLLLFNHLVSTSYSHASMNKIVCIIYQASCLLPVWHSTTSTACPRRPSSAPSKTCVETAR